MKEENKSRKRERGEERRTEKGIQENERKLISLFNAPSLYNEIVIYRPLYTVILANELQLMK